MLALCAPRRRPCAEWCVRSDLVHVQRNDLDFTDRLWEFCKEANGYIELRNALGTATSTFFGTISRYFSSSTAPHMRRGICPLDAHAYRMLIGACNRCYARLMSSGLVFRGLQNGSLQPMIHRTNTSMIAEVARRCLPVFGQSGEASGPSVREMLQKFGTFLLGFF